MVGDTDAKGSYQQDTDNIISKANPSTLILESLETAVECRQFVSSIHHRFLQNASSTSFCQSSLQSFTFD